MIRSFGTNLVRLGKTIPRTGRWRARQCKKLARFAKKLKMILAPTPRSTAHEMGDDSRDGSDLSPVIAILGSCAVALAFSLGSA